MSSTTLTHGMTRRQRRESEIVTLEVTTMNDGVSHRISYKASDTFVADRYCEKCGKWVEARGIVGALMCPVCSHAWDKKYWEDGNE